MPAEVASHEEPFHRKSRVAATANFKGSLVLGQQIGAEEKVLPAYSTRTSKWASYVRDGWGDVGLWKSAASNTQQCHKHTSLTDE